MSRACEWSGAWSGRSRSGNGVGRGLNRLLRARSNLTFHSTDFITYIVRIELSAVYSFSTGTHSYFFMHLPYHLFKPSYNPAQLIFNETQSISSTWRVLVSEMCYWIWRNNAGSRFALMPSATLPIRCSRSPISVPIKTHMRLPISD